MSLSRRSISDMTYHALVFFMSSGAASRYRSRPWLQAEVPKCADLRPVLSLTPTPAGRCRVRGHPPVRHTAQVPNISKFQNLRSRPYSRFCLAIRGGGRGGVGLRPRPGAGPEPGTGVGVEVGRCVGFVGFVGCAAWRGRQNAW